MRKITKLLLTAMLLVAGVGTVNAGKLYADLSKLATVGGTNATWDGGTNTITWVNQSNNMVSNFDFPAGDYSSFESITVSVSGLSNAIGVRIQIRANGQEKTKPANGNATTTIRLSDFGFTKADLESVEWIRLLGSGWYDGESHTINAENPASAVISEVYLYKPAPNFGPGIKTPLLLLKNGTINSADFDITPVAPSTLTTDNLYAATFTSKGGYCNTFKYEGLDVSAYDKAIVIYTIEAGNGDWHINRPSGGNIALPIGFEQVYVVDLKGVDTYGDFTVFNYNHSGKSITISEVYLFKSLSVEFEFDAFGKGTVDKSKLTATGGLTYDPSTGALSSDGTAGSLALEFATPVDMRNLFQFNVANSGSTNDILSRLEFYDEDDTKINTWNSIKLGNTWNPNGIDDNATNAFLNHKPVKRMVWPSDANASNEGKTATITSVAFTCKTIACAKAGETILKSLPWINISSSSAETPAWNMNGTSDTYYGNYSGDPTHYADLTSYSELRVYCTDNTTGFRAFFINADASATFTKSNSDATWHGTEKYYSLDLTTISKWGDKVALKSIKSNWGPQNVTNIVVYQAPAANAPQYILTGSGMQLEETVAALADATATAIDATGVTGITTNSEAGRTLLTSANPNCLFLGTTGNGGLANTQNVITSGTCDNLVLTDNHPFQAPSNFTATAASYSTTINTTAQCGTLCLPFEAAIPGGVTAYTLSYVSGNDAATLTPVETTIPANTPVLLNGSGAAAFAGSGAVDADATNVSGALTGVFANTVVPLNSYVLQNGASGIGFYKVASDITAKPFRAYLTGEFAGSKDFLSFNFDEATAISQVQGSGFKVQDSEIFNLAGQRMSKLQKGVNIVNGKKVMVK